MKNPVLHQIQMEHLADDIRCGRFTPEMRARRLERLIADTEWRLTIWQRVCAFFRKFYE